MAHYAFLDDNNLVIEVITGIDETELIEGKDPETWYGEFRGKRCLRTSYNGNIRKNYAVIGGVYDEALDAFIRPKPFESWILNEETCEWNAPIPYPAGDLTYFWNEDKVNWELGDFSEPNRKLEA
jgi:hypothetical protein